MVNTARIKINQDRTIANINADGKIFDIIEKTHERKTRRLLHVSEETEAAWNDVGFNLAEKFLSKEQENLQIQIQQTSAKSSSAQTSAATTADAAPPAVKYPWIDGRIAQITAEIAKKNNEIGLLRNDRDLRGDQKTIVIADARKALAEKEYELVLLEEIKKGDAIRIIKKELKDNTAKLKPKFYREDFLTKIEKITKIAEEILIRISELRKFENHDVAKAIDALFNQDDKVVTLN